MSDSDTGVPGQIWTAPVLWTWAPTHCMNWPIESTSPPVLWRKCGDHGNSTASCSKGSNPPNARIQESAARIPRQLDCFMLKGQQSAECPDTGICRAQGPGAPACAYRVKQIDHFLFRHGSGHGDLLWIEIRKGGAQPAPSCNYARDPEADVVSTLVAENLWRQAGHDGAFHCGRAVRVDELLRERSEEPCGGGPKADADNVRV